MNGDTNTKRPLSVVELFAGVGGFRHGLQAVRRDIDTPCFDVRWSNQWEPSTKAQHAATVYKARWGEEGFVNRDLSEVLHDEQEMSNLIALAPDVLVGGFPCQDYSVARPLNQSQGLEGKKGVLWWSVYLMLRTLLEAGVPVKHLILENVGRILGTPAVCKGRDFAVILASLQNLGYAVEWRVVNAADYGFPQARERIFIVAHHASTQTYQDFLQRTQNGQGATWLTDAGTLAHALPARLKDNSTVQEFPLSDDPVTAQVEYVPLKVDESRFQAGGVCINGTVWTGPIKAAVIQDYSRYVGQCEPLTLGDVVAETKQVPQSYFINDDSVPRWEFLKGRKAIPRVKPSGYTYFYKEGPVQFPDSLDRASRTIITSEGGASASRTRHAIRDMDGRLRRLIPEELEALNGFPRGFTDGVGLLDNRRAFLMGNALVTGLVRAIGAALFDQHTKSGF
jgi:DNA (cytosine-5)-methyltransferase 1